MNGLAIDCSISKLTIGAKNQEKTVSAIYDIGMKQSETLLPAIDYVLKSASLELKDLSYISVTTGPGSFTGLRLGLSAAKAISLAHGTPIFSVNSLDLYANPFLSLSKDFFVLSEIDAKKDRFYAECFYNSKKIIESGDFLPEEIAKSLSAKMNELNKSNILICGPDSEILCNLLKEEFLKISQNNLNLVFVPFVQDSAKSLFSIAEKMIQEKKEPLKDYDGPLYIRASEAEVKFENK